MRIIVEGLDGTGKTTTAKYLSNLLNIPYHKIKKTVPDVGTRQELAQSIINEISDTLGDWNGILDRGYFSAVATGMIYDSNINPDAIICPDNLRNVYGILMVSMPSIIEERCSRELTKQDKEVIGSENFMLVQDWLYSNALLNNYHIVENYSRNIAELEERVRELSLVFV